MTYKHEHVSASRLALGQRCRRAFRRKYIDGIKEKTAGEPARIGSAIHSAIERATYEYLTRRVKLEDLGECARVSLLITGGATPQGFDHAEDICLDWGAREGKALSKCIGVERKFEISLGKWNLIGYLDRVDMLSNDHVEIVDYKTGYKIPSKDEYESSLQTVFYAAAGRKLWPWAERYTVRYAMLRHKVDLVAEPSDSTCESYLRWATQIAQELEDGPWPGTPNEFCAWCSHCDDCPDLEEVPSEEDFFATREHAAAQMKVLRARKDAMDKAIKARLEETGRPLRHNGTQYQLYEAESRRYDLKTLLAALSFNSGVHERDIAGEICKLASKDVRAKWAKKHDCLDILESTGRRTRQTRLWARRVEGPEE